MAQEALCSYCEPERVHTYSEIMRGQHEGYAPAPCEPEPHFRVTDPGDSYLFPGTVVVESVVEEWVKWAVEEGKTCPSFVEVV